jgi:hypothetical protein
MAVIVFHIYCLHHRWFGLRPAVHGMGVIVKSHAVNMVKAESALH